ncbi:MULTISPECIES: DUF6132 family protein [Anaeromyxobacter]|uniref:DUF6132 family protein n=1 Tax=Anaeromyxobacter TaxID=161492 RepID=UPI001F57A082|nr:MULTISPECIES: DUF6132 family protein [unclassified Anaeromyxobacter]
MNARAIARAHWRTAGGAAVGAAAGAAYAYFIGCNTGTCPLTSSVWTAALFFGFAGGVVGLPGRRAGSDRADASAREQGPGGPA